MAPETVSQPSQERPGSIGARVDRILAAFAEDAASSPRLRQIIVRELEEAVDAELSLPPCTLEPSQLAERWFRVRERMESKRRRFRVLEVDSEHALVAWDGEDDPAMVPITWLFRYCVPE